MTSLQRIGLLLFLVVLLPAVAVLSYQLNSLDQDEEILQSIYEQQLETLLYSVNQHAWEVADNWARLTSNATQLGWDPEPDPNEVLAAKLNAIINDNPAIASIYLADAERQWVRKTADDSLLGQPTIVSLSEVDIQKLIDRQQIGYQQLKPVMLEGDGLLLAFAPDTTNLFTLLGIEINTNAFVQTIIVPKMQEVARGSFELGVFRTDTDEPLFATGELARSDAKRERAVWLLPDIVVGVQLKGKTIEQLVDDRLRGSFVLVGVLGVVLSLSVWFVYRSVRREMVLAQLKSDFVSNVSHELRTPLALIRMYVETLELNRVRTEEKRKSYYEIIRTEAERLTRLIDNILTFSKIEAGKKEFRKVPMKVGNVVEQVMELYHHTLAREQFEVNVDIEDDLPEVLGDEEALKEALINLVDNAIKYSQEERVLNVSARAVVQGVALSVEDKGMGIRQADHGQVFEKFFRVTSGDVHDTKGTGLGLSLVRHIVEAHGGVIDLTSRPGQGSRFTIQLPAHTLAGGDAIRRAKNTQV